MRRLYQLSGKYLGLILRLSPERWPACPGVCALGEHRVDLPAAEPKLESARVLIALGHFPGRGRGLGVLVSRQSFDADYTIIAVEDQA
jgi:hypothetical protein